MGARAAGLECFAAQNHYSFHWLCLLDRAAAGGSAFCNPSTSMNAKTIDRRHACLLVVDLQERLFPTMIDQERILQNSVCLVRACAILGIPIFVTEQYPRGLGATLPQLAEEIPDFAPLEKLTFSACGHPDLMDNVQAREIHDVILCGIEAHVCVTQTCLGLINQGHNAYVVTDAVSSRTLENKNAGLERMRNAGAGIVSTEMALFELMERAGTDEFKRILPLIK